MESHGLGMDDGGHVRAADAASMAGPFVGSAVYNARKVFLCLWCW